jgi:hypothetical protein
MNPMNQKGGDGGAEIDRLWLEYRAACPDPEASVDFMPKLWQRIEARRLETVSLVRRMAEACVMTAIALTLVFVVLAPRIQREPVYRATYVDVLDASHASDATDVLAMGEVR